MNKFFEFHDYLRRQNNRPYFRGAWERLQMEAFRLLPFQYKKSSDAIFSIYQDSVDITDYFFDGSNKITDWTLSGGGTFLNTGSVIHTWDMVDTEYISTNDISLTTGDKIYFKLRGAFSGGASVKVEVLKTGAAQKTLTGITESVELAYTATATTATYRIKITCENSLGDITSADGEMVDTVLDIYNGTDDFVSYDGSVLYDMITNGESSFEINTRIYTNLSDYTVSEELYSEDCDIGCVNSVDKFTGDATDTDKSFTLD
ncbi:MAG: hypothetical protein KAS32_03410, partial [Candidatus Peribacteraceae bacterium]|nr:hypothetical protein [Candidatus Peribacteraceae bacterium]